jgi:hypothetical protein
LPLALGLQIILLHDLRDGRNMAWSVPMKEEEGVGARVDIRGQIESALDKAHEDHRAR